MHVTCARCKKKYNPAAWLDMPFVGHMFDTAVTNLELRNCPCGGTMCKRIQIARPAPTVYIGTPFFFSESTVFTPEGFGCTPTLPPRM